MGVSISTPPAGRSAGKVVREDEPLLVLLPEWVPSVSSGLAVFLESPPSVLLGLSVVLLGLEPVLPDSSLLVGSITLSLSVADAVEFMLACGVPERWL